MSPADATPAPPGPTPAEALVVHHDEVAHRYEGRLDGAVVAVLDYVPQGVPGHVPQGVVDQLPQGTAVALVHTGVVPAHENEGLATRLVDAALADVRRRGWRVVPACSFVRMHLRRHAEEYADLL